MRIPPGGEEEDDDEFAAGEGDDAHVRTKVKYKKKKKKDDGVRSEGRERQTEFRLGAAWDGESHTHTLIIHFLCAAAAVCTVCLVRGCLSTGNQEKSAAQRSAVSRVKMRNVDRVVVQVVAVVV